MSDPITVSATIHADGKKTWDYYTGAEHIIKWNFADPSWCCPSATNDMRTGGKYSARMEAKDGSFGFDFEVIYDEVVDGERFSYTMLDGRKASVDFRKNADQTDVTISFDPENENPVEFQKAGWQAILDNFKNYTEAH